MYNILTFENGLRLVYEKIPYVRSVATGVWVGTGSRHENQENNGVSHFVEHMLFKGTQKRSAKEIAQCIDGIGGQINAFTGKECTCFYTKTLDTHLDLSFDLLADMFFNSKFADSDLEVERKVIIEEINMYEDSPEELVHDLMSESTWHRDPLGYSILGTKENLEKMDATVLKQYMADNYHPWNTIVAVAGNFDETALVDLAKQYFGAWKKTRIERPLLQPVQFEAQSVFKEKDTEQVHLCIGFEGLEHSSEELYALLALNNILGGGMSSRLFQKVREEYGLVYSIYSYPSSYHKAGLFNIYVGMNPDCMEKVLCLIGDELKLLKKEGIRVEELLQTKEQLKGNYILGLESTSSRMNSIGKALLLLDKIHKPEEILEKIDAITMDGISRIVDRVFDFEQVSLAAVGQIPRKFDFKNYLL